MESGTKTGDGREDTAETRAQGKPNLFLYSTQLNKYAVSLTINTIDDELF